MYVATVPNRGSRPAILLRESYREGDKVKTRTLKNLSDWPAEQVEALRGVLSGARLVAAGDGVTIERALLHGHVLAALETARAIDLERLLPRRGSQRCRGLALAMIVGRMLDPAAKLATARMLDAATASHSLGAILELGRVTAKELYAALDWLGREQPWIEKMLARRHLQRGTLVLYDLTSTYLEGRCCALAQLGYSRDGKRGKRQIVFGALRTPEGCPVAVEVFAGNTGDPSTLSAQVNKIKERFGLDRVVLVGDRGMITAARIEADLRPAGLDWITALRAPAIQKLAVGDGPLPLSFFDERDLAEIASPDFPGERLIVCRNPALAAERARKREDLLTATEKHLGDVQARVRRARNPLHGAAEIGKAVGKVLDRYKVGKHFDHTITDTDLVFRRKQAEIDAEAALDGVYVLRTGVPSSAMEPNSIVAAYKSLSRVERFFRSTKTVDLEVRPVFHWASPRVRADAFLCMLAYYLEWHMRQKLAPILFDDHDRPAAEAQRASPVAKAVPSPAARRKAKTKTTADGLTVCSFRGLIDHLASLTRNTVRLGRNQSTTLLARPTTLQQAAFDLLGISLAS